jgi:hypothetical protein
MIKVVTFIVIVIIITFIIVFVFFQTYSVLAIGNISNAINPSILLKDSKLNLSVNYVITAIPNELHSKKNLTLWIETPYQILQQIKNVSYQFYPVFKNGKEVPSRPIPTSDSDKNFPHL